MSVGALIALVGFVLTIIFWVLHTLTLEQMLLLFGLAFLAILFGPTAAALPWPWHRN